MEGIQIFQAKVMRTQMNCVIKQTCESINAQKNGSVCRGQNESLIIPIQGTLPREKLRRNFQNGFSGKLTLLKCHFQNNLFTTGSCENAIIRTREDQTPRNRKARARRHISGNRGQQFSCYLLFLCCLHRVFSVLH